MPVLNIHRATYLFDIEPARLAQSVFSITVAVVVVV